MQLKAILNKIWKQIMYTSIKFCEIWIKSILQLIILYMWLCFNWYCLDFFEIFLKHSVKNSPSKWLSFKIKYKNNLLIVNITSNDLSQKLLIAGYKMLFSCISHSWSLGANLQSEFHSPCVDPINEAWHFLKL